MADNDDKKPGHTLADHVLGQDFVHEHEGDADHDHDHFEFDAEERLEENPIWIQDHVTLVTVGIDIGSSGTQVIFSRINLRRYGEDLTSRYYVVSRETLFQSPVALTPYASDERIDDVALGGIIDQAYAAAGVRPEDIDTGVVILTGEALRRENAEAIAGLLAEQRGDFVTATAGHHMESMLAAYGSGASKVSYDRSQRILNIDIGGGTTKLAIVENGNVTATAALHIGGRLQVVDDIGRIVRLDPAGKFHARQAGFYWSRGDVLSPAQLDKVADSMADLLVAALASKASGQRGDSSEVRAHSAAEDARERADDARPEPARGAHAAPGAARDRASLSDRSDRRARPHRRAHGVGRRGGIRLRPRAARLRRHGTASRPRHPGADRFRRAAVAAAAGRRMHPRDRARRLRIQRAAQRQYQLHLQARRALAAPQSAGSAALLRLRGEHRRGQAREGDPRAFHRLRPGGRRGRGGARAALAGRALLRAHFGLRRGHPPRPCHHDRAQEADLHHARRRHRADIGGDPARGALGRERDPGDRRGGAARFRLHRSRPHPDAVLHRAGHDQVVAVQRGPAPRPSAPAHPSP